MSSKEQNELKIKSHTATDLKTEIADSKTNDEIEEKLFRSLVNLQPGVSKTPTPVEHPNFIPDYKKNDPGSNTQSGALEQKQQKSRAFLLDNNGDTKSKPPIHTNITQSESFGSRNKPSVTRSVSHDQSHDSRNRGGSIGSSGSCDKNKGGSIGSFGSRDSSRTNEEEVVISYQDEAVDIELQGGGNRGNAEDVPDGQAPATIRLVIMSSKMRNTSALRHALQPGVVLAQYTYDNSTLDGILGLVSKCLGSRKCESVALILSCSGLSIQFCGKEEKVQLLNRENITENQPMKDFFTSLITKHVDQSKPGVRLDFLACNLLLHTDGGAIDKEIETWVGTPVRLYKDLGGGELLKTPGDDGSRPTRTVGELYFRLEKLRGWSGQQQQTLAGFEKIQTVGKGAYGAAVLYKKKDDDSLVILKEINMHDLKAAERQMALNEVNILAMLEHPNIISYYDSFEEDGVIMIEMEYADGGTLAQYLSNKDKAMEEKDIITMFEQIVAAIRHIHQHNILHRDLKTANIFLTKEGVIKVGDFGISKMMSTANQGANTVLGTPYYISPEMCEGKPYNDKSDIWALGCILYEMACLQKTFEGSNLPALVNKIMKGQFAPVKGNYSQEFKDTIMLMLSQDPGTRPSATDLMYTHIPQLLAQYEESSDNDEESTARVEYNKKKTRTILYYFDSATAGLTPIELNPKVKIRSTAVGGDHVMVVTTESQVFTWGEGTHGQLGHGDTLSLAKPKLVEALTGKSIARACCGDGFSVFASDRGIVLTCGDGMKGCLGHGDMSSTYRPRLIESLLSVDVIAVACCTCHVMVVGSDGEVFSWGNGADGKLGLGNEDNQCQPMKVTISEPVLIRDVFCGLDGTMFLTDVGSVFACGSNTDNKLGLNNRHGFIAAMRNIFTRCEVEGQKVPTPVRSLARHRVLDISMGRHHTAVIVEPGKMHTFGRNVEGQLGIEGTKPASAPVEVKAMAEKNVVRVQCGDHYTVTSTDKNEIYYWGLRFRDPSNYTDDTDSRSSMNGSSVNTGDMRVESVTPRNASHSRQASTTSGISLNSLKDSNDGSGLLDKETEGNKSPQRQVSVESNLSGLTDSGYTGEMSAGSEMATRTGFRPLSSVPRRSTSASSRENTKEKEKDGDTSKDDSKIIFPPDHLMKIVPGEEMLTLSSFFCHGENIFMQLETTAPPPRKKARKKRGIRKRYSGSTLPIPNVGMSASSREGGDEYSSEASEMDTQGTVPTWIKKELAMSELDVNDGNLADDTSDQSDDDRKNLMIDSSMSSIQINKELTPCKNTVDKNITPRNTHDVSITTVKKISPRDVRARSISNSTTESEVDLSNQSDGSAKDLRLISDGRSKTMLVPSSSNKSTSRYPGNTAGYRAKSAAANSSRSHGRVRSIRGHDVALKDQLAARGFVSDVTVKRREEALLGELRMTRDEKTMAEQRLRDLELAHQRQEEMLRQEAEQRAIERERQLQEEIKTLKQELQSHSSQLQQNQKVVLSLQEQLGKVEKKKSKLSGTRLMGSSTDSKVCVLQ